MEQKTEYQATSSRKMSAGITVNKVILAANIIIYIILMIIGEPGDSAFMMEHGALYVPYVIAGHQWYLLVTSMFLHFTVMHLFGNMVLLYFMGDVLERTVGRWRYLAIYLLSGLAGNLLTLWRQLQTGSWSVSAGASGAIFGVLGALLYIMVRNHGRLEYMGYRELIFFILFSLYVGYTSTGVNNLAHLGGLIGGFIICIPLYRRNKKSPKRPGRNKGWHVVK